MRMDQILARVRSDNDQDAENLAAWMRESMDDGVLVDFWLKLNKPYENATTEVMTRFAIYGFAMIADKIFRDDAEAAKEADRG